MKFNVALTNGRPDTSNIPSIPSGRGPKIRNATTNEIVIDIMYIIRNQKLSCWFMIYHLSIHYDFYQSSSSQSSSSSSSSGFIKS